MGLGAAGRALTTLAAGLAFALAGCSTTHAPTYPAQLHMQACPLGRSTPGHRIRLGFSVSNPSRRRWPAVYLLLQPRGAISATLTVHRTSQVRGIGGYITRVDVGLTPGGRLNGQVSATLTRAAPPVGSGPSFLLAAWGAPANSVAVPTAFAAHSCALHG